MAGQIAVAWTIRNRVNDGKPKSWWGQGLRRCVPEGLAVQLLEPERPDYVYLSGAKKIPAGQFVQAQKAADQVITGTAPDPTDGATHYYATTMPKAPAWSVKAKQTLKLGHHVFFKDVR